jgi:glutathione synthase/RimK-type ligase-like ATP-grasp enzyme
MEKQIDTIGTTERVSFPKLDIFDVPAKIDTGADSSALWATNVQEMGNGRLQFVVFGSGSHLYTGSVITTQAYRQVMVKNSFGVAEPRYKVRLLIQIGERKIRAWFTLADRAGMRYPVLLGRRLLKGKFVVDVGKKHVHAPKDQPNRVLILRGPEDRETEFFDFVTAHLSNAAEFVVRSFNELSFWVENNNLTVRETVTNTDIASYNLVYFKSHQRYYEFAIAAAEYLQFHHVPFFDEEVASYISYDKLSDETRLAVNRIPVPEMFCASQAVLRAQADDVIAQLGMPFVCKEINADRSRKNYLLQSRAELDDILESAAPNDIFLLQRYVPNDGYLRMLVFGPHIALAIYRHPVDNPDPHKQHLNTPAGAPNARLLTESEVPKDASELARKAARVSHRQIAGIDLIQDKQTGQWLVLEVNISPQIFTGSFVQAKREAFAKFIDFQLDR